MKHFWWRTVYLTICGHSCTTIPCRMSIFLYLFRYVSIAPRQFGKWNRKKMLCVAFRHLKSQYVIFLFSSLYSGSTPTRFWSIVLGSGVNIMWDRVSTNTRDSCWMNEKYSFVLYNWTFAVVAVSRSTQKKNGKQNVSLI